MVTMTTTTMRITTTTRMILNIVIVQCSAKAAAAACFILPLPILFSACRKLLLNRRYIKQSAIDLFVSHEIVSITQKHTNIIMIINFIEYVQYIYPCPVFRVQR